MGRTHLDLVVRSYGIVPKYVISHPAKGFFTLLTSMFLHSGWTHLIGNMGALITLVPIFFIPFFFEIPAILFICFWFLVQFFNGTLSLVSPGVLGGIAWWAHIGGFLSGVFLHRLFVNRRLMDLYDDEIYPF